MTTLLWLRALPIAQRDRFAAALPWHLRIAVNDVTPSRSFLLNH